MRIREKRDETHGALCCRNIFSAGQLGIVEKTGADDLQTQADRSAQVSIIRDSEIVKSETMTDSGLHPGLAVHPVP